MTKKTVGEEALNLQQKAPDTTNAIELQQEIHKGSNSKRSYEEELLICKERALKDDNIQGDFFLEVHFRRDRNIPNLLRSQFCYHQNCPSPTFDQTLYKYTRNEDKIEFIWVIPNNALCQWLPTQKQYLPLEQFELLGFIEDFLTGKLDQKADKLNNQLVK